VLQKEDSDKSIKGSATIWKEHWIPIKRLLTNKLFVANMFSSVFSMFIISGFGTFAPKLFQVFGLFQTYMSRKKIDNLFQIWNRFRESESGQKFGILIFARFASLLLGGYIISRLQPRARFISIWNCFATLSFLMGILSISFLDCKRSQWINKGYLLFHQHYFLQQKN